MNGTDIVNLLRTNDKAVARALVVLTERQTSDEQVAERTKHVNGRGFRPAHAKWVQRWLSSIFVQVTFLQSKLHIGEYAANKE